MIRLTISFLGSSQVAFDGQALNFRSPRLLALFAYLVLEPDRPHTREALAGLFWPDEPDPVAKQNLRQALYQLRQILREHAEPFIVVTHGTVQFNRSSDHELDVAEFFQHLAHGRMREAAGLYHGELLAQLTSGSDRFEEWLMLRREQLHILALDTFSKVAEQGIEQENLALAQEYARRQLALEPWREHAHRQLMLALARSGERSAALAQYELCRRVLDREFGVEPEPETTALFERLRDATPEPRWPDQGPASSMLPHYDWGDAPDVSLYGREQELGQLSLWLADTHCRVVGVLGMGGIGKTALAACAVRQVAPQFDVVIWRTLLNAPVLADLLDSWLRYLTSHDLVQIPSGLDAKIELLFGFLRKQRVLLILDNAESIMQGRERAGSYRAGYEDYGQLLLRIGQGTHQSTLLLTSREQPRELSRLAAETTLVKTLAVSGLELDVGSELLADRGLNGGSSSTAMLVERYSGNPLALKLVAEAIQDLFAGDIDAFLGDRVLIFDDIRDVLDQQFSRLPALERDMLLWLAIEREPVGEDELWQVFARTTDKRSFLEALRSLLRRSLVENHGSVFGMQNVVTEYLTDYLVTEICREVETETPKLLASHALLKASAKEYVRQSQQRIILQPLGERLNMLLGAAGLEEASRRLLAASRLEPRKQRSFLAGNLLNMLLVQKADVRGFDFSGLALWQAYLRGVDLPDVDFSHADFEGSVFTDYVGAVTSAACSPDGQHLATGMDNGLIYLWQLAGLRLIGILVGPQAHVWALAYSPDGERLISSCGDITARIWDVNRRQMLHILSGHQAGISSLAFHPDGTVVVTASSDRTVRVWSVQTGEQLHLLQAHTDRVMGIAFSVDGATLASAGHDQMIHLWDWQAERLLQTLEGHDRAVVAVAYSPRPVIWNGRSRSILVSASHDQTVGIWDAQTGELLARLTGHSAPVLAAVFSPDSTFLASGSDDQTVRIWDMQNQGRLSAILQGHYGAVNVLAIPPRHRDEQPLLISASFDKTLRLWDIRLGHALTILRGHSKWLQALVFTPDGRLMVGGSDGQNVRIWDGQTGRALQTLHGHTSLTEKLGFRADGAQLVSGGWDNTARLWDTRRGLPLHTLEGHTAAAVTAAIGSHGRSVVASGSLDQTIRLWDVETGKVSGILHGHRDRVVSLAFHPDGAILASGCWDHRIGLWNIESGELVRFLETHTSPIESVAFHPSGNLLASAGWDGDVLIWDLTNGLVLHTLREHTNGLEMVVFSPNGEMLASCGCDKLICVWDVQTGRLLYRLEGHANWVRCVTFSPDSRLVASGSDDGTVKLWDLTPAGAGCCHQTIAMEDPYAGMNITGATGLTDAQRVALIALGAVEKSRSG